MNKTFAEHYCARHAVAADGFERALLRRCLHRRVSWMAPAVHLMQPDFFAPDLELVRCVGRLRRDSDFALEVATFRDHPENQHWLRRRLRMRLSVRRLHRLFRESMQGGVLTPSRAA